MRWSGWPAGPAPAGSDLSTARTHASSCTHARTHARTHTHIRTRAHTNAYMHTHTLARANTRTHARTHTDPRGREGFSARRAPRVAAARPARGPSPLSVALFLSPPPPGGQRLPGPRTHIDPGGDLFLGGARGISFSLPPGSGSRDTRAVCPTPKQSVQVQPSIAIYRNIDIWIYI